MSHTNNNTQPVSTNPRFSSFRVPIPTNTNEPSNSNRNTDRETESHERQSRGSQRRNGRSKSPRESSSRHYRRRSRDTTHSRHGRSHRRREEEEATRESLDSTRSRQSRQSRQHRPRSERHEEVEPPHESQDSTPQSRQRRPRSERRPPTKPYPHKDSETSISPEIASLDSSSTGEDLDHHRESLNEQHSASEQGRTNQPSEIGLSENTSSGQGDATGQQPDISDRPRYHQGSGISKTPDPSVALGILQHVDFQNSRFEYPSRPATLSSDISRADLPVDDGFCEYNMTGDPDILRYGRPKNVINYRLGGRGYVLGLGYEYRIDRDRSDHTGVVLRPVLGDPYSRDKQNHLISTSDRPDIPHYEQRIPTGPHVPPQSRFQTLIFPDPPVQPDSSQSVKDSSSLDPTADFVPMDPDDWGEPPAIRFDLELPNFPASMEELLTANGCPTAPPKITDLGLERRSRNNSLIRAAFDNPTDVSAWLKAINYQDIFVRGSESESLPLTKNELHSLAEMKLSLYSKALRRVGQSNHRDALLLGRLQIGAQLWERKKLLEQWKETLTDNSDYIALWAKYLDFFQTDSPSFSYPECLKVHLDALEAVARKRRQDSQFSSLQTYIFLRLTIFQREAGYHEFANSLWQAVLEYCFFKPDGVGDTPESGDALTAFKTFWESEVARIGEPGAKGWNNADNPQIAPLTFEYPLQDGEASLIADWTKAERDRMGHLFYRSLDAENPPLELCQSVCLFSDARRILELFDGWDSADSLINAFLCFNHLPPIASPRNMQDFRAWSWDSFLRTGFAENHKLGLGLWRNKNEEPPKAGDAARNSHPFTYPLHSFVHTTDTLFATPDSWNWFTSLPWWEISQRPGTSEMIQRTLQSLVKQSLANPSSSDDELIEYYLAFEFSLDPRAAKVAAKKILKERKDCFRGWNCLAMMEWMVGSKERANFMWSSVISNSANILDRGTLWHSWIWKYLGQGKKPAASYILFSMASGTIDPNAIPEPGQHGTTVGPVLMAQTQSSLRESQAQALASHNSLAYVAYTDCLALLYYLSNWPLRSALEVYGNAITALEQIVGDNLSDWKEYTAELLHQAQAKLIYHILKQHPKGVWKPIELRPFFKESLTRFPHNTMIATVWIFIESKILRIDRIRTLEELIEKDPADQGQALDITIPTEPISSILLPIWAEISSARGADRWVVRPLFEKALEGSSVARSNLTIWKLYILYELDHVEDVAAAKSVFYRAINACPWSKELAMLGFEQLQRGFATRLLRSDEGEEVSEDKGLGEEEVERLFLVICERRLHVRLDVEREVVQSLVHRLRAGSPPSPDRRDARD